MITILIPLKSKIPAICVRSVFICSEIKIVASARQFLQYTNGSTCTWWTGQSPAQAMAKHSFETYPALPLQSASDLA